MPAPQITHRPLATLTPWARNARTHSTKQIRQIAASIRQFGFTTPVLIEALLHESSLARTMPTDRILHLPMRYDTGRPRAVIRLRISQPRTTSLPCPAGLRARRPSPMMDLYRKNAFSTRP